MKSSIYVQTQSKNDYLSDSKITAKHWKVYYYLLSISYFDAQKVEDHRYVYRKNINITQICRELGIKSTKTFYNAIKRLEQNRLVRVTDTIYYLYAKNWIDINKNVLSNLVKYAKTREQDIDLLRTFLILKKMNKIAETSNDKAFTIRQLCVLLGHGDTHPEYYSAVRVYLALLSFWGLIVLKQHKEYNDTIGSYTIFHLQGVKETDLNDDFETDIEAEMNAPLPSQELMDKLKFQFPEIVD